MKKIRYFVLMLLFLFTAVSVSGQAAGIHDDLKEALVNANKAGKILLVDFYGGWCPWCVKMDETLADPGVKTLMQDKFYYYKLDIGRFDRHKECLQQYEVEGIPYIVVFNSDGSVRDTCDGYLDAGNFKDFLIEVSANNAGNKSIHPDLINALQEANRNGKLLLVDFYGGWCPWCVKMDETLADPGVKTLMQDKFYYYKLDIGRFDQHVACLKQYRVKGIPFIAIFNSDGGVLVSQSGYRNANAFKSFLMEAVQTMAEAPTPSTAIEKPAVEPKKSDVLLTKGYGLSQNEDLKYINPSLREEKKPTSAFFHWSEGEGLSDWIVTDTLDVRNLLRLLVNVFPQETEGDQELLITVVPGDFVVRTGTAPDKIVGRLEEVLRRDLKLPVRLSFRDVERKVIMVQGTFHLNPLSGQRPNRIEIYSGDLNQDSNSGILEKGDFQLFFKKVGMYLNRLVISYVKGPEDFLEWHYSEENGGSRNTGLVLQHLAEQTGLTFKEKNYLVRILFVERGD